MSRPHCARSFPPKLSISDSCRFLRVRAVSGLPVFLHLIWFLQFLFCFSIPFHSAQLLRRVYHTIRYSCLLLQSALVCHDRNCSGSVTRKGVFLLLPSPTTQPPAGPLSSRSLSINSQYRRTRFSP